MTTIWVASIILIGQGLVALTLLRITHTFGVYVEKLLATHHQNLEIRKNVAVQKNTEAIDYFLDNPQEREA